MAYAKVYQPSEDDHKTWADCGDPQAFAGREHERYVKERGDLNKVENEAEKNFDTLLVTISSIAIAASFTLVKDVVNGTNGWIIAAWLSLGFCLIGSLTDRLYTYLFNKEWRLKLDDVFRNYIEHCGHAWKEAHARLDAMRKRRVLWIFPAEKFMSGLKWVNFGALFVGLVLLAIFVYIGAESPPAQQQTPAAEYPSS